MSLSVQSSAFNEGAEIPRKFTCDGPDHSPALSWTEPPPGTRYFALVADDPDAPVGVWVHWVIYDMPASARALPEGVPKKEALDNGARQGRNDFGRIGYGGPCPPPGKAHRYYFKLFALDAATGLKSGITKVELEKAMEGHVLAEAQLMGRYKR